MKQFFGNSHRGDLKEAAKGLHEPSFIMLLSNQKQFDAHVKELEHMYPRVPSIGCIGMSYGRKVEETGVGVIALYDGINAVANVLE